MSEPDIEKLADKMSNDLAYLIWQHVFFKKEEHAMDMFSTKSVIRLYLLNKLKEYD